MTLPLLLAMTGSLVRFDVCSSVTGEVVDSMNEGGVVISAPLWINPDTIIVIAGLHDKPCTLVKISTGTRLFVKGSVKQIACKLQGGPNCE